MKEIDMFEYRFGRSPQVFETGGRGPSLGIGIYDRETKSGYLGNFLLPDKERKFYSMIKAAKRRYDVQNLEVTLTGMEPWFNEETAQIQQRNRAFVIPFLKQQGFTKIIDKRLKTQLDNDQSITTRMDFSTGVIEDLLE